MNNNPDYAEILADVESKTNEKSNPSGILQEICNILVERCDSCDWAGFYIVNPDVTDELVLGPFSGASTEHVRIRFGSGICGQAAMTKETFIVDDVTEEVNYLSCSPDVKSEIVIPVFCEGAFIGELDIDSHRANSFSDIEVLFYEQIAELSAVHLSQTQKSMSGND